jgi:hypothetical protein
LVATTGVDTGGVYGAGTGAGVYGVYGAGAGVGVYGAGVYCTGDEDLTTVVLSD